MDSSAPCIFALVLALFAACNDPGSETSAGDDTSTEGEPTTGLPSETGESSGSPAQCDITNLETFLVEICELRSACGCDDGLSVDACYAEYAPIQVSEQEATAFGLHMDCACLEERRARSATWDCRMQDELPNEAVFPCDACRTWVGDQREGEPCQATLLFHDCGQGLSCFEGTCIPACAAPGAPCGYCNIGSWCDPETEACVRYGREGDSCEQKCDVGFICDEDSETCTLGAPGGTPCDGNECRSGQCVEGICEPTPPVICARRQLGT